MESLTDKLGGQEIFQGLKTVPPSLIGAAVIKHHDQNNLFKEGLIWLSHPERSPQMEEAKAGTWRQKLKKTSQGRKFSLLTCFPWLHYLTFFYNPRPLPRGAIPPYMALWYQLLIPGIFYRFVYRPVQWRHCLTWGKLCLDDSNLHQVEKNWPEQAKLMN